MVRRVLVAGVIGVATASAWGLSLGPFAGHAVMGRPLDINIPLTLGAGESASDLCPVVRVYFGEDPLGQSQVRTSIKGDGGSGTAVLHVTTLTALTEPYARVDVVAGCTNQFSRQYTILADLPAIEPAKPVKVPLPVSLPVATVADDGEKKGTPAGGAQSPRASQSAEPVATKKPAKAVRQVQSKEISPSPSARQTPLPSGSQSEAPALQGARLKLDPVELVASAAQWSPSLKMAAESAALVNVDANPELEQRRAAARALWRAMNEEPEQLATKQVQAAAAAAETQAVRQQLAAARQAEAELQVALQTERDGIYSHPVVLALGGGLLLALGGFAWVMRRGRPASGNKQPWWKKADGKAPQAEKPAVSVLGGAPKPKVVKKRSLFAGLAAWVESLKHRRKRRVEDDSFFPPDSLFKGGPVRRELAPKAADKGHTTLGHSEFSASSLLQGNRSMATEELFDLQQQVEFFISLGQAEQAVDVLVAHLSDSLEPSPLAYLDLLRLYHDLDRRTEYEALRKDFNRQFGGAAPAFENYSQSRRGLERYEKAISRIQSLWPTPAVLDVIEGSIFRQSSGDDQEVFDLEAYRELLLLYGIAREIIEPDSMLGAMGGASSFGYFGDSTPAPPPSNTELQPLTAQTRETLERDLSALPNQGPDTLQDHAPVEATSVDLDIDLSLDFELGDAAVPQANNVDLHERIAGETSGGDGMTLDLSDSMFALPTESPSVEGVPAAQVQTAGAPATPDVDLSLDFSALGDIENFTIRKSGTKA